MSDSESHNEKPSFSSGRRWWIALNSLLGIVAFLALVVMLNYLANGHFKRFQWARDSAFELTPQSKHVLQDLTNDVEATIFFQPHAEEDLYSLTSGLLAEYQNINPRHLHVRTLDYTRFPGEAKDLLARHNLNGLKEKNFVLFECGDRSKIFYAKDLADYDFSDVLAGRSKSIRRSAFRGEMYFTSAILALSYPQQRKTYFVYGHGEHDPGNPTGENEKLGDTGYSKLAAVIKNEISSDWDRLLLKGTNPVPADCELLIIAGPRRAQFEPNEIEKIDDYLKHGGRLLALLETDAGLAPVLAKWGLGLGESPVVENDKTFAISQTDFLTAAMSTSHAIMKPLIKEDLSILIVQPRPVYQLENNSKAPGAPTITALATTSKLASDGHEQGSFPLMQAVEQGVIEGVKSPRGGTRMVVVGDSYFLDDQMIDSAAANHYFAGLALNWLLDSPKLSLEGLSARPIKEYKLILTNSQTNAVRWLFLAGMPGAVLFFGGLVWLRRRS